MYIHRCRSEHAQCRVEYGATCVHTMYCLQCYELKKVADLQCSTLKGTNEAVITSWREPFQLSLSWKPLDTSVNRLVCSICCMKVLRSQYVNWRTHTDYRALRINYNKRFLGYMYRCTIKLLFTKLPEKYGICTSTLGYIQYSCQICYNV